MIKYYLKNPVYALLLVSLFMTSCNVQTKTERFLLYNTSCN